MKLKLRIQDLAKLSSVETITADKLKHLKGGKGPVANGLENFPSQAKGCPPPLEIA